MQASNLSQELIHLVSAGQVAEEFTTLREPAPWTVGATREQAYQRLLDRIFQQTTQSHLSAEDRYHQILATVLDASFQPRRINQELAFLDQYLFPYSTYLNFGRINNI